MSVSYIVPVWREDTYERVARPWLLKQVDTYSAELIEIRGAKSIFSAQESGRKKARFRYIMYVHDDVKLIEPENFTEQVIQAFVDRPKLGMIGPVGKIEKKRVPWWFNAGNYVGHWCRRGNQNQIVYQYAADNAQAPFRNVTDEHVPEWDRFAHAGLVDGFYLIEDRERLNVPWDTETYGEQWHGYDIDRCFQAHELGLDVMVPPWLFMHDNAGHAGYKGSDPKKMNGADQANRRINSKGDELWLADLDVVNQKLRQKWGVA